MIELRDVIVSRRGEVALQVDELLIDPGVTAIVGANGSGKSTLLHTIAGLLHVNGTVLVRGSEPADARRDVAYVFQTQHASEHLLVTAGEVVALGRAAIRGPFRPLTTTDRSIVRAVMERLDVADLAARHLAEMSGGQRQRVFIAQGLAQQASVLLLDEPLAGLDLPSMRRVRDVIAAERDAGRTVLTATHDLAQAMGADRVVLLAGHVVAAGTPDEVLRPEHLRRAYGSRVLELDDGRVAVDDGVHHEDHDHVHHDDECGP